MNKQIQYRTNRRIHRLFGTLSMFSSENKNTCFIRRLSSFATTMYRLPKSTSDILYEFRGGSHYQAYKVILKISETRAMIVNKPKELYWIDDLEYELYDILCKKYKVSDIFGSFKAILEITNVKYEDTMDSYHEYDMFINLYKCYSIN